MDWPLNNMYLLSSHNELDILGLTNPLMYEKITARRSVPQQYEDKLIVRPYSSSLCRNLSLICVLLTG
jgi:2-oxoglutarate dehydrogenase complex dehydrogenase (E1) component-like enzyme